MIASGKIDSKPLVIAIMLFVFLTSFVFSQKAKLKPQPKPSIPVRSMIFAVTGDGTTIEPVVAISDGKLVDSSEHDETYKNKTFSDLYFKSGNKYNLVFGGVQIGTINVVKSASGECSGVSAQISANSTRAKLKGFVMALATNTPIKAKSPGVRRLPTANERNEAERLVRAEFTKQKVPAASLKQLRYHNLTAIDVDRDGKVELVGTFWIAPKPTDRATLFFIATQNVEGTYSFELSEFVNYTPENIMSGEAKDLDDGVYHELLLDYLDYDGDGVAELFTTTQAFEGRNFSVYRREAGKWAKVRESYNYRCGY
jgi:hypothetical protein